MVTIFDRSFLLRIAKIETVLVLQVTTAQVETDEELMRRGNRSSNLSRICLTCRVTMSLHEIN